MKKFSVTTLEKYKTLHFIKNTENLITIMVEKKKGVTFTKITKEKELAEKATNFLNSSENHEYPTKQSLLKTFFPRTTWQKQLLSEALDDTFVWSKGQSKVVIENPKEKTDVRFLIEKQTAMLIANQHEIIDSVIMKSEKPKQGSNVEIHLSKTNKNPDLYVKYNLLNNVAYASVDVKSGNNSMQLFKNVYSQIPLKADNQPYLLSNTNILMPEIIQKQRIQHLKLLGDTFKNKSFHNLAEDCDYILNTVKDPILSNTLIQEKLLVFIVKNPQYNLQPSLYVFTPIKEVYPTEAFYKALEPHTNVNIFDDNVNAKKYMKAAVIAYNKTIKEIGPILDDKDFWQGTGFESIEL